MAVVMVTAGVELLTQVAPPGKVAERQKLPQRKQSSPNRQHVDGPRKGVGWPLVAESHFDVRETAPPHHAASTQICCSVHAADNGHHSIPLPHAGSGLSDQRLKITSRSKPATFNMLFVIGREEHFHGLKLNIQLCCSSQNRMIFDYLFIFARKHCFKKERNNQNVTGPKRFVYCPPNSNTVIKKGEKKSLFFFFRLASAIMHPWDGCFLLGNTVWK